jgi:asparagine synthase (glutamine-hydrolysing)
MAAAVGSRAAGTLNAWAEGPVALGFRPRRRGPVRQPARDGDWIAILDGWIYEHEDLARTSGATPGQSDTESLAASWRRSGPSTLAQMEGEFAAVLWDRAEGRLHLVRDALGVRPLFVTSQGERFAFASHPDALAALPWVRTGPDWDQLAEYLSFQVVHAPRTLLRGIAQVEPGHHMVLGAGLARSSPWWIPQHARAGAVRPRERDLVETVLDAAVRAVRRRAPPGRPTGLYLSGGLGSAAVAVAARHQGLHLPAFTVSLDDEPHPESPFAGRVARLLHIPTHHEVRVGSADIAAAFDDAVATLGQPVGHASVSLQWLLGRAATANVEVALSGDGGDELFGGRMLEGLGRRLALGHLVARLPRPTRAALAALPLPDRMRRQVADPAAWPLQAELGGKDLFHAGDRRELLRDPDLVRPTVRTDVLAPFYADLAADPINTVLWGWMRSWLSEGALPLAERTAAASGLDLRFPLLDRAVLQAAFALPGSAKVRRIGAPLHARWPLRALLSGALPPPLIDRPKRGLPVLPLWLARAGRLFFEARLSRLRSDPVGPWNPAALDHWRGRLGTDPAAGARLWSLFVLDAWIRRPSAGRGG